MTKQNLYIFIGVLLAVTIALSLLVFTLQRIKNNPPSSDTGDEFQPSPTSIEVRTTIPPDPTEIPAASRTGALEEQLPKEVLDLATQKQSLKSKLPVTNTYFTITFDYAEDKFTVTLKEPKTDAKTNFTNWLKANYPAITEDRFVFK